MSDRVEREHDRVVITRNGREAAVLISAADRIRDDPREVIVLRIERRRDVYRPR